MPKLHPDKRINTKAVHAAYTFQQEATAAVKDLEYSAVFHEQGLGKTKIALDTTLYWLKNNIIDSVVIVTKRGLVENWKDEIRAHTHIAPVVLSQNKNLNYYALNSPAKIYVCHYEVVGSEYERFVLFCKSRDVGMILDESHKIKNPLSNVSKSFHAVSQFLTKKMIMTGTPISNRPYDIWSQIYFLDSGESLGDNFTDFKQNLDLTGDLKNDDKKRDYFESELKDIWNRLRDFCVRETKSGAGISLPRKNITMIETDWETDQQIMYNRVKDEMRVTIVRDGVPIEDESEDILKRLLRLIQIASNPFTVDETYDKTPGKFNYLLTILSKIINNNEKAIVWTSFIKNAEWLYKKLEEYKPVLVHGGLSMERRNASIRQFKSDKAVKILVATPGAAKEGLTLTVANHAIFYDRSFSLEDYLQAQDRIHRISQAKESFVYNFIMNDSIDIWVNALIQSKALAAQLGQGDIDYNEYAKHADYSFKEILHQILAESGV